MVYLSDTLSWVGVATGALLALVGLGTLVGPPWAYGGAGSAAGQVLGAVGAVAVGVGLAWLVTRE